MNVPIFLTVANNTATALVGRNLTPLADADPGIQARFDRALTDYDGATSGPLVTGSYLLIDEQLIHAHRSHAAHLAWRASHRKP